ncbi:MAG: RNA polymerase sigma factor [Chitinophagaceae bacterium]|nr:RNA polymerase sigma factor [Chitinophagaceae bacterium]
MAEKRELAFTWLVKRDQKKIYWFIRRMVIDHDDANDLVQDTFIRAWNSLSGFRGESKIIYWLYRIATNITLTYLDKKKRKGLLPIPEEADSLMEKLHSGNFINGNNIQMHLQEAILSLPERQRLVFQLRYYDEIPYEEMSGMLDTSVGALKASYHHAVKKVEKYMLDHQ